MKLGLFCYSRNNAQLYRTNFPRIPSFRSSYFSTREMVETIGFVISDTTLEKGSRSRKTMEKLLSSVYTKYHPVLTT